MRNRVLAAEDSPTQAAVLHSYLTEGGFEVSMAANGAEALALLAQGDFDIVVSDVVMPEMDGYELCQAVKEHDRRLPVVLLTSLTDPLDVVRALAAGADNFLRKPYQADELVHRVRNMVHNKQLRESGRAQMGLELSFLGRRFMINAEREQVLDLLVSTFEDLVVVNQELQAREDQLAVAHEEVSARLAEADLERERLRAVLAALPQGMMVVDRHGVVVDVNENLANLLGVQASSLLGRRADEALTFLDPTGTPIEQQQRCLARSLAGEHAPVLGTAFDLFVERSDGTRFPALARSAPVCGRDGATVGAVGVLEDIGVLLAHDQVTGLPGHGILLDRLRGAAERGEVTGLLVVTIDRFDRIRQSLSSGASDQVVVGVVERLTAALARHDVRLRSATASAAYLGNGEVAVVVPGIDDEADAVAVGELLVDQLRTSLEVQGVDLAVTTSVAVGMVGEHTDPAELVLAVASAARRLSSSGGSGLVTSDPALHAEVVHRLRREAELRTAIGGDELVVHYQPKVDLRDGRPVAVEALVRWQHPEHGLLGAGDVIPLAVESGMIGQVGWWVLEQACRQAAAWRQALVHGDELLLSVNVAAEQLVEVDFAEHVEGILRATGFDPVALILEITEGSVMVDTATIGERLRAIKALGVRLAIDDFGTGYSSLLQLRELPVDLLKIDRTFVAGMLDAQADAAIVAGTIGLARALGLQVIAEGVERADQAAQLRALGCNLGQGYHWARPLPADELERWWSERSGTTPPGGARSRPLTYGRRAGDGLQHLGEQPLDPGLAASFAEREGMVHNRAAGPSPRPEDRTDGDPGT